MASLLDFDNNSHCMNADEIPFDYSPLWSIEELAQRQELELATSGYQDMLTFSLYEPCFMEYMDRALMESIAEEADNLFPETGTDKHVSNLSVPITPLKHVSAEKLEQDVFIKANAKAKYMQRVPQSRQKSGTNLALPVSSRKRKRKSDSMDMDDGATKNSSPKKRKKVQTDGQDLCCIKGCDMAVTNRLRFSLRCTNEFKKPFIERGWNKICHRHYFADLYRFKKQKKRMEAAAATSAKKN